MERAEEERVEQTWQPTNKIMQYLILPPYINYLSFLSQLCLLVSIFFFCYFLPVSLFPSSRGQKQIKSVYKRNTVTDKSLCAGFLFDSLIIFVQVKNLPTFVVLCVIFVIYSEPLRSTSGLRGYAICLRHSC
jgi:hypothetical protein